MLSAVMPIPLVLRVPTQLDKERDGELSLLDAMQELPQQRELWPQTVSCLIQQGDCEQVLF